MPLRKYTYWNKLALDNSWKLDDPSLIPALKNLAEPYVPDFIQTYNRFTKR